jgi:hypothetical protein
MLTAKVYMYKERRGLVRDHVSKHYRVRERERERELESRVAVIVKARSHKILGETKWHK